MTNDSSNENAGQIYVLALEDEYDPPYNTLHTFTDPAIWEWLIEPVTFPEGEYSMRVSIPGTNHTANISSGSHENDKAQALLNTSSGSDGSAHPNLTEIDYEDDYDATLERLRDGAAGVYVGLWY